MKIEYDDYNGFNILASIEVAHLPVFIMDDYFEAETFYTKNRIPIANVMYLAIVKSIENDFLEIPVCRLHFKNGRRATLSVTRDSFDNILQKCLKVFEETEEYEKCNHIVKLLNIE